MSFPGTTSGTDTFNPVVSDIISAAYRHCGVLGEDEDPTEGQTEDALFAANSMIKEWDATGIHIWTEEEGITFLQPNQPEYFLGKNSTDNFCEVRNYEQTTLAATAVLGAGSISVASTAGPPSTAGAPVVIGNNVGIVLDSGSTFWTTISKTGVVGSTVNLTKALPSQASAGNNVFFYTVQHTRPLRIPFARRLAWNGLILIPAIMLSRQGYEDLPNPLSKGTPTQGHYRPSLNQGRLYVWPVPPDSSSAWRYTWYRQIQDLTAIGQTFDFPQEWANAIGWNLAKELGPDFDIPEVRWQRILFMASEKLELVKGWDREPEPIEVQLEYDSTQR